MTNCHQLNYLQPSVICHQVPANDSLRSIHVQCLIMHWVTNEELTIVLLGVP